MKREEIDNFEKIMTQLESLHLEIGNLSKKSQNDAINKFKLKFINQAIVSANEILGTAYKPFEDFIQFEESDIPSNSDVTMMLGQYLNCMDKLRDDNVGNKSGYWVWRIDGQLSDSRTKMPKKLTKD
jgi:hypothetical protein